MKFRDLLKVCESTLFIYDSKETLLMTISCSAFKNVNNKKIISLFGEKTLDSEVETVMASLKGLIVCLK